MFSNAVSSKTNCEYYKGTWQPGTYFFIIDDQNYSSVMAVEVRLLRKSLTKNINYDDTWEVGLVS